MSEQVGQGLEQGRQEAIPQVGSAALGGEFGDQIAALYAEGAEMPVDVEAAAVRHPQTGNVPPAATTQRDGYWKKPTEEQLDNTAKKGFDLTAQRKY